MTCSNGAIRAPDYRVTCSNGELVLIPWHPGLIGRRGPSNELLLRGASGSAFADLTILRDGADGREVIVSELTESSDISFQQALTGWATSLGYRRVWLRDELVEFDPAVGGLGGVARTRCRTCGSEWYDDSPEFWLMSRDLGIFPIWCPLCGAFLPQWSVAPRLHDGDPVQQIVKR
jgi:hypothetical protein